jgi:hypothetical protein
MMVVEIGIGKMQRWKKKRAKEEREKKIGRE